MSTRPAASLALAFIGGLVALLASAEPDAGVPKPGEGSADAGANAGVGELVFFGYESASDGGRSGPVDLRAQVNGNSLDQTFTLAETRNQGTPLQLQVSDLRDAAGAHAFPVTWTVDGHPAAEKVPVGPRALVKVNLKATLTAGGTYSAQIVALQGELRRLIANLTVVVQPDATPKLALAIDEIASGLQRATFRAHQSEARVSFTVREKEGRPVLADAPQLMRLVRKPTSSSEPIDARGAVVLIEDSPAGVIPERTGKTLTLKLSGLPGAGCYEGAVRISAPDAAAAEKTFVLFLREGWYVAFAFIFIGVVVSYLLRLWASTWRPKLVLEYRIQAVLTELDALLASKGIDDDARALVAPVRRLAVQLLQGMQRLVGGTTPEAVTLLEQRVPLVQGWIQLWRAVQELEPPELRKEPTAKLEEMRAVLWTPSATAAQLDTVKTSLDQLPAELTKAARAALQQRIDAFRQELDAVSKAAPSGSTLPGSLKLRVVPLIDKASAALGKDVAEAGRQFLAARAAFASVLSQSLLDRLAKPSPYRFVTADAWRKLETEVRQLVSAPADPSAEAAVAAYNDAFAHYLRGVSEALKAATLARSSGSGVGPEQKKAFDEALAKLDEVAQAIGEGRLGEASAALELAIAAYGRGLPLGAGGPLGESTPGNESATPVPVLSGVFEFFGVKLGARPPADRMASLAAQIWLADLITAAFAVLVASVLGLKLLWLDQYAWGGMNDRIIAFIWGFGLHQATYASVGGLLQRWAQPMTDDTKLPPAGTGG